MWGLIVAERATHALCAKECAAPPASGFRQPRQQTWPSSHGRGVRHMGSVRMSAVPGSSDTRASAGTVTPDDSKQPSVSGLVSSVPTCATWELDFCSRPLLDERGKKVWELTICDARREFEYTQYFPNNKINSSQLRLALEELMEQEGAVKPKKVKFFRGQMQTIITRALMELDIEPVPSRRCFALMRWLEERLEQVYMQDERYSAKAGTAFTFDLGAPAELDDALRGEQWVFVQLPLAQLREELREVEEGRVFGAAFDLAEVGAGDLPPDTMVPGVAVFSRRAGAMAAWTNALELACVGPDVERSCLMLETGVRDCWRYGAFARSPQVVEEANAWKETKAACRGLHFLAIQADPESDDCAGLWLLQDREPPAV